MKNIKVLDPYMPPLKHQFREEIQDPNRPIFMTKIKPPEFIRGVESIFENRPQETINREMRDDGRRMKKEEEIRRQQLGFEEPSKTKEWVQHQPRVPLGRLMGSGLPYPFLDQGMYDEDLNNQVDMGAVAFDNKQLSMINYSRINKKRLI